MSEQKIFNAIQEIARCSLDTSRRTFNRLIKDAKNNPDKRNKINMVFSIDEKTLNEFKDIVGRLENKKGKSVKDYLQLRNLKKLVIKKELSLIFCPLAKNFIKNPMVCHLNCRFGHMEECHYPYDCSSEYCGHYAPQRAWEREMGVPENNSDGLYHFKLLIYHFLENKKRGVENTNSKGI